MEPEVNARVNLLLKPVSGQESEFDNQFITLKDKTNNRYYCLKSEYDEIVNQEEASWLSEFFKPFDIEWVKSLFTSYQLFSGELLNLPIPSSFKIQKSDSTYTSLQLDTKNGRYVIPFFSRLERNINKDFLGFLHFCKEYSTLSGTACTQPAAGFNRQLYFTLTKEEGKNMIPLPKNNDVYEGIVIKYNQKNQLFFIPLTSPCRTIIYAVSEQEATLKGYIEEYYNLNKPYSMPLNGFIIPIDDWDCFIHFLPEPK